MKSTKQESNPSLLSMNRSISGLMRTVQLEPVPLGKYFFGPDEFRIAERVVRDRYKTVWTDMICDDMTADGIRKFLNEAEAEAKKDGQYPSFAGAEGTFGTALVAEWSYKVPYTEEEIVQAKVILASRPEDSPLVLKWRKPVPFDLDF